MKKVIPPAIYLTLLMTVLTGLIYPLAITEFAQLFFQRQANGSMIRVEGKFVGSRLIGQNFMSDKYFWSRPSAIGYNPMPSGASNYGPTSDTLKSLVEERKADFIRLNGLPAKTVVPADMLYASGSGLDPDISPESAELQIDRIAKARNFDAAQTQQLKRLVKSEVEGPEIGLFGEARVNVLTLNLALDKMDVSRR